MCSFICFPFIVFKVRIFYPFSVRVLILCNIVIVCFVSVQIFYLLSVKVSHDSYSLTLIRLPWFEPLIWTLDPNHWYDPFVMIHLIWSFCYDPSDMSPLLWPFVLIHLNWPIAQGTIPSQGGNMAMSLRHQWHDTFCGGMIDPQRFPYLYMWPLSEYVC